MQDYKDKSMINELAQIEPVLALDSELNAPNDSQKSGSEGQPGTSQDESLLPKTPTGTRINKKGKNLILLAGASLGVYIIWAMFNLSPKTQATTGPQDSVNISASALSNQQNQGQTLVTTLKNQAYGSNGIPQDSPNGANGGQSSIPSNLAGIAPSTSNEAQGNENNNSSYQEAYNSSNGNYSGGQQQNPYQQAVQAGMQSSLTPDGFQSGDNNNQSNGSSYNSMSNNPANGSSNANAAIAANTAIGQALASTSSDDQNMQGEKNAFLQNQTGGNDTLQGGIQNPASPFMIMAGSIIPATLITGINSDLPGQIQAIVSQNVYDSRTGNSILIPQGSRLIGTYDSQVAYGQSRVLIVWSRVIFPNNQYIDLEGMPGADLTGYAGLTDEVNNHYFRIYGSALLMSIFSAGMQLSQPNTNSAYGTPTNQQIIAGAMGQQLGQTATDMIQKNINIQPTIEIRPGDNFNVLVTRDIPFNGPYSDNVQPQIMLPTQGD